MLTRCFTAAALAAMVSCAPALAAPVTVQLRVEGATTTIFEGPVTTDAKQIDKGGGPHPCDGTNGGTNPSPGPTMTSALDDGSVAAGFGWSGTWFNSFQDYGIDGIGPDSADFANNKYWGYALNFVPSQLGGCQQQVHAGDEVLFGYDFFSKANRLRLAGPASATVGGSVSVTVTDGTTGSPVRGATVGGTATRADGEARLSFDSPGLKRLKAERPDSIRSNALVVCAAPVEGGDCGLPVTRLGSGPVRDAKSPLARISKPRSGARYRRGPRLLQGTASDEASGVRVITLALRRRAGAKCSWWSGRRERFVAGGCGKARSFEVGEDPNWSYLLPSALRRGRYRLDVKAIDRAGNSEDRFIRGKNRVKFEVLSRR
jgi:hypothetical protein